MDPRLQALLASVDEGDFDALGPLADYLEERGDPRAALARSVMTLEPPLIAQALCEDRGMLGAELSNAGSPTWIGLQLFMGMPLMGLLALLGVAAVGGLAASPANLDFDAAIEEVEEAIRTRKLTGAVASAITLSRLIKRDQLLAQLRDELATDPSATC